MPKFGKKSKERLNECHPDLQKLFNEVIKDTDCTILCGHRTEEEQDKAFKDKVSRLKWPESKHNTKPSMAIDVAPYPLDWQDTKKFYEFGKLVIKKAKELGINIRWGGDWDMDGDYKDQKFNDLPHFELVTKV